MIKRIGIVSVIGIIFFTSCVKDITVQPDDCNETISFQDEILPDVFNMSCNSVIGCHSSEDAASGYVLETYDQIAPSADIIAAAINRNGGAAPMPLDRPKLADEIIEKFECWISQGKLNN